MSPLKLVYTVGFLVVCWCVAGVADLLFQLWRAERRPL